MRLPGGGVYPDFDLELRSGDMGFDPLCDRYTNLTNHLRSLSAEAYMIRALIEEVRRLREMLEPVR